MDAQRYRPDIDGLRCIAVIAVLLSHIDSPVFAGGFIGVDVFFVISGYLITGILMRDFERGDYSILRFYERRARRILPALTVVILATLAMGALALGPTQFESLAWSAISATSFASNIWFWLTSSGYFGADVDLAPLLHTWSLGVEEQFYILFPLLLLAAFRHARRRVTLIVVLASVASLLAASVQVRSGAGAAAFYLLSSRAWALGLGALVALAPPRPPARAEVRNCLAVLALAGILVPVFVYTATTPFPGLAAVPPTLGTAALIWLNDGAPNHVRGLLARRPLVLTGLISYSLYLWHWPVIVFAKVYFGGLGAALGILCVLLSFALAVMSWRFIEQPFRSRDGLFRHRGGVFVASGGAIVAMVAASLLVIWGQGFEGRLSPQAAAAFAAAQDVDRRSSTCFGHGAIGTEECRLGTDEGPADFLLWGDSHAAAVIPAVDRAAQVAGKSGYVFAAPACAPLINVIRLDQPRSRSCVRFNDRVLALLRDRDDMPVVILEARWALAAEGTPTAGEGKPPALLAHTRQAMPAGSPEQNFRILETGFRETVAAIQATGRAVVVLGAIPEIGWDVPARIGQRLMHDLPIPAGPSSSAVHARFARVDALFRSLSREMGFLYVPLADTFCDAKCRVMDARGHPIYRDDDHLSRTGALRYLTPVISSALWTHAAAHASNWP